MSLKKKKGRSVNTEKKKKETRYETRYEKRKRGLEYLVLHPSIGFPPNNPRSKLVCIYLPSKTNYQKKKKEKEERRKTDQAHT
jgi:hypothetical protein